MNKGLLERQEAGLYPTLPMLSVIFTLLSATLRVLQNMQTLQQFLSPLYVSCFSVQYVKWGGSHLDRDENGLLI